MKFTVDVETKLVPFTVNVKAPDPAVVLLGEMLVVVGAGLVMVSCWVGLVRDGLGVALTVGVPAAVSL